MRCGAWAAAEFGPTGLAPLGRVGAAHHAGVVRGLASGCRGEGCGEHGAYRGIAAVGELCGDIAVDHDSGLEDGVLAGLAKAREAELARG